MTYSSSFEIGSCLLVVLLWNSPHTISYHSAHSMNCEEGLLPALTCDVPVHITRLCVACNRIRSATCQQVNDVHFLESIIHSVGLVHDHRARDLYGSAAQYMLPNSPSSKYAATGLWQNPGQLAPAMHFLGAMNSSSRPISYLELGIFSGWTATLMASWLTRLAGSQAKFFHGTAVDINAESSRPVRSLMQQANVHFTLRKELLLSPRDRYDLCFIDGDHSFKGVRADYEYFAPHCGMMMFHDTVDSSSWLGKNGLRSKTTTPGSVPLLWAQLRRSVQPERIVEFVEQNGNRLPAFGLGILLANQNGTCEPSRPLEPWTDQNMSTDLAGRAGGRIFRKALWGQLCGPELPSLRSTVLICAQNATWFESE